MNGNFKTVQRDSFRVSELLHPLNLDERKTFTKLLHKIQGVEERNRGSRTALSVFLIDNLHEKHTDELATAMSVLVNKLVTEPFKGDRSALKMVLESIMGCVAEVESEDD